MNPASVLSHKPYCTQCGKSTKQPISTTLLAVQKDWHFFSAFLQISLFLLLSSLTFFVRWEVKITPDTHQSHLATRLELGWVTFQKFNQKGETAYDL